MDTREGCGDIYSNGFIDTSPLSPSPSPFLHEDEDSLFQRMSRPPTPPIQRYSDSDIEDNDSLFQRVPTPSPCQHYSDSASEDEDLSMESFPDSIPPRPNVIVIDDDDELHDAPEEYPVYIPAPDAIVISDDDDDNASIHMTSKNKELSTAVPHVHRNMIASDTDSDEDEELPVVTFYEYSPPTPPDVIIVSDDEDDMNENITSNSVRSSHLASRRKESTLFPTILPEYRSVDRHSNSAGGGGLYRHSALSSPPDRHRKRRQSYSTDTNMHAIKKRKTVHID